MEAPFTLRTATPADAAAVTALLQASYPALLAASYAPEVLAPALPVITRANPELLAAGTFYLLAATDGTLAACGGWTKEAPGSGLLTPGEGHLRHFAVHPDQFRRGLGRRLLGRCRADAREAGLAAFNCHSSLAAVEFYRAMGFIVSGPITFDLAPGVALPGVVMRLQPI